MTPLQHHLLALALTTVFSIGLGLFVWLESPRRWLNQLFALHSLAIAWWAATEPWSTMLALKTMSMFWLRIEHIAVFLMPPLIFHLVAELLELRTVRRFVQLGYLLSAAFICLIPTGLLLAGQVRKFYSPLWMVPGPLYHWAVLFFWVYVTASLWYLWRGYHGASGSRRLQIKSFFIASLLGYLGGGSDFLPVYNIYVPWLNPYGLYLVPIYKLITAYAILQYHFLDIHVFVRKSLIYSLLVGAVTTLYFGAAVIIERIFQQQLGYHSLGLTLAVFALITIVFQPLKIGIQRMVDFLIFRAPQQTVAKKLETYEARARDGERYRTVATLAAGISHELKNPLAAVQTYLEYLPAKGAEVQFRQQFYEIVGAEVKRLQHIAQGLLDFSKPQAPVLRPIDIRAVLEDVLALVSVELRDKGVTVKTTYTNNGTAVVGDAGQLSQVFLNLILNAREAMEHGGALTIVTSSANGHVEVQVADTGCGIHPKDLAHIFEPFFSKKTTGTGLGLSIVQSIIHEHHGTITVQSTLGCGTTFIVKLPL